ncbi:GTPase IMAP family member 4-like [Hoplias malabaricus]|uniref:GTPase IMAP family member 4-like n=1 Tax=Hoplias malabaricus TaxID=27720 RepID=UPI0034628A68
MEETRGSDSHGPLLPLLPTPNLHIVLIGEREAGKSAVGNAILGARVFDDVGVKTRVSVAHKGVVRGHGLVVVDTPGWEWFNLGGSRASPGQVRKEMVGSLELCHPGAHALLLVVPLSFSFSSRERCVAEEHVELFGPEAWNHTLVLFTVKNVKQLRSSTLQDEVEANSELQRLVENCRGRYHALHNHTREGEDLVAELLDKIHKMVSNNGGAVLRSEEVMARAQIREEEEEKREENERKEREQEMRRARVALRKKKMEEREDEEMGEDRRQRGRVERRFEAQHEEMSSIMSQLQICCKTQ